MALEERTPLPGTVVFIDGECLLCNRAVAFLAERDPKGLLHFAHLQGLLAAQWLPESARDVGPGGTVVLIETDRGNRVSSRSAAILRALGRLDGPWSWVAPLASVPGMSRLLDVAYRYVARNRDRWFGRDEKCLIPTPALRARFVEPE